MFIHITGASGSGTTTLGAALAPALSVTHLDGDHYYWLPSTPPFQHKRDPAERYALLRADLRAAAGAVASGSMMGWGADVEEAFDLVVFLYLPAGIRVDRLRRRELERYGRVDDAFLTWAAQYDEGPPEGRSLARHEEWLARRTCPVLRLTGDESVAQRVDRVLRALPARSARGVAPRAGTGG